MSNRLIIAASPRYSSAYARLSGTHQFLASHAEEEEDSLLSDATPVTDVEWSVVLVRQGRFFAQKSSWIPCIRMLKESCIAVHSRYVHAHRCALRNGPRLVLHRGGGIVHLDTITDMQGVPKRLFDHGRQDWESVEISR
jgi:hypothetical protein